MCVCPTKWLSPCHLPCHLQVICPASLLFAFCLQSLQSEIYPESPNLCLYFQQAVSSWTCLCTCPTKWLLRCMRQVACPASLLFAFLSPVSTIYNLCGESKPVLVFSASTVSSWTCLCACPTKWLSPCLRQIVCSTFVHVSTLFLSPVSTIYNLSRESKPAVLVFSVSTVSSWTCLCACPTKWLSQCMRNWATASTGVCWSIILEMWMKMHLVSFSVCLSVFLPICSCLLACLPVSVCIPAYLSIC